MASNRKQKKAGEIVRAELADLRAPVTIEASVTSEDGAESPATFSAVAYSGGEVPGYTSNPPLKTPYVINLKGMDIARSPKANLDHQGSQRVGHVPEVQNTGRELKIAGVFSAATKHRDEVVNSARSGFDWEVSIEGSLRSPKRVAKGKTAEVNGRTVHGPITIFQKSTFTGVAFASNGADAGNQVSIAASAAGEETMNEFEQWVTNMGLELDTLNDEQKAELEKTHKASLSKPEPTTIKQEVDFDEVTATVQASLARQDTIANLSEKAIEETPMYQSEIEKLRDAALADKGVSEVEFELELMRACRPRAGAIHAARPVTSADAPEVFEAALAISAGLPKIEDHYDEETLDRVYKSKLQRMGLNQFLMQMAVLNGYTSRPGETVDDGNMREVLDHAFGHRTANLAGWSTNSVSDILSNLANKELSAGYMEVDTTWREIADVRSARDFKTITTYRLLDDLESEKIGPAGEIKHGQVSDESRTRKVETYGKMISFTRQDIINDDLGAFDDMRTRLGQGSALSFNNTLWAVFMDNVAFFTAERGNLITGASTALGDDGTGLQEGITAYRQLRSPDADGNKRIGSTLTAPSILLVPPELEFIAQRLWQSSNIIPGSGLTGNSSGDANIHAGKYRPVIQNRLSDSAFTGNSSTAWYLFGSMLKPIVASFLNGQQTPTVQSAEAPFNTLGIQMRVYHDFGADLNEEYSGIKSAGA